MKRKVFSILKLIAGLKERQQFTIISGVIAIALIVLYFFDPASSTSNIYPPSPFRALTGLYCPGCGTLRGLHQLLHGHLLAALGLNPLMVVSLPFLIYAYASYSLRVMIRRSLPQVFIPAVWIWRLLAVILGYWFLRNLPVFPFSWLAP